MLSTKKDVLKNQREWLTFFIILSLIFYGCLGACIYFFFESGEPIQDFFHHFSGEGIGLLIFYIFYFMYLLDFICFTRCFLKYVLFKKKKSLGGYKEDKTIEDENILILINPFLYWLIFIPTWIFLPFMLPVFIKIMAKTAKSKLVVPRSVRVIENNAYRNYLNLRTVIIHNKVKKIGNNAFLNCPIETAVVPAFACKSVSNPSLKQIKITSGDLIEDHAFEDSENLKEVQLCEGIKKIEYNAFIYCRYLKEIVIPDSVECIKEKAFGGCEQLNTISFGQNSHLKEIGAYAFSECKNLSGIVIPDTVESIRKGAFYNCENLASVSIGQNSNLKEIEELAFYGCNKLIAITIPNSVNSIGKYAFCDCDNLEYFENNNGYYLGNADNQFLVLTGFNEGSSEFEINEKTKIIYNEAFFLKSLEKITVNGNNFKSLDGNLYSADGTVLIKYAVGKQDSEFVVPNGIITISDGAFCSCKSLTNIVIPESVKIIEDFAFAGCDRLNKITIPRGVEYIGYSVFKSCEDLKSIYYNGTKETWKTIADENLIGEGETKLIRCTDGDFSISGK